MTFTIKRRFESVRALAVMLFLFVNLVLCLNAEVRQPQAAHSGKRSQGIEWVTIPGGTFTMGDRKPFNAAIVSNVPAHQVTVKTFQMARTEVTNRQYQACVDAGACTQAHFDSCHLMVEKGAGSMQGPLPASFQGSDQPVVCVSWDQAKTFAVWAGGRLPTEAEWEYAARSGGKDYRYSWGNEKGSCQYNAPVKNLSVMRCVAGESTRPVCSKPEGNTEHGLCDMTGNVSEWVQDWFHPKYDKAPADGSAWETPEKFKAHRGSEWAGHSCCEPNTERQSCIAGCKTNYLGFRLARSVAGGRSQQTGPREIKTLKSLRQTDD